MICKVGFLPTINLAWFFQVTNGVGLDFPHSPSKILKYLEAYNYVLPHFYIHLKHLKGIRYGHFSILEYCYRLKIDDVNRPLINLYIMMGINDIKIDFKKPMGINPNGGVEK